MEPRRRMQVRSLAINARPRSRTINARPSPAFANALAPNPRAVAFLSGVFTFCVYPYGAARLVLLLRGKQSRGMRRDLTGFFYEGLHSILSCSIRPRIKIYALAAAGLTDYEVKMHDAADRVERCCMRIVLTCSFYMPATLWYAFQASPEQIALQEAGSVFWVHAAKAAVWISSAVMNAEVHVYVHEQLRGVVHAHMNRVASATVLAQRRRSSFNQLNFPSDPAIDDGLDHLAERARRKSIQTGVTIRRRVSITSAASSAREKRGNGAQPPMIRHASALGLYAENGSSAQNMNNAKSLRQGAPLKKISSPPPVGRGAVLKENVIEVSEE